MRESGGRGWATGHTYCSLSATGARQSRANASEQIILLDGLVKITNDAGERALANPSSMNAVIRMVGIGFPETNRCRCSLSPLILGICTSAIRGAAHTA